MTQIKNINSLDTSAIIDKLDGFGAKLALSSETREDIKKSIFDADGKIKQAQGDISNANGELSSAESKQGDAEGEVSDAKTQSGETESKSSDIEGETNGANQKREGLDGMSDQMVASSEVATARGQELTQENQVIAEQANQATANITNSHQQIDANTAQMEQLMASSEAAVAEIQAGMEGQDTFDGTGSGTSSAYSLSTGFDMQQMMAQSMGFGIPMAMSMPPIGMMSGFGGVDPLFNFDAQFALLQSNASQMASLQDMSLNLQPQINQQIQLPMTGAENAQQMADAIQAEGQEELSGAEKTIQVTQTLADVGDTIDVAGTGVKVAGKAMQAVGKTLSTTGTALGATGGGVTATGTGITTLGGVITAIGTPLCAFFGLGAPIVAGGGATTAGGVTTTGVGGTVTGVGTSVKGSGITVDKVGAGAKKLGQAASTAGKALNAGAKGVQGVAYAANGEWGNALQAVGQCAASAAGTLGSFQQLSQVTDGKFAKVAEFAAKHEQVISVVGDAGRTVRDGVQTVKDIGAVKRGEASVMDVIADGTSALSHAFGAGAGIAGTERFGATKEQIDKMKNIRNGLGVVSGVSRLAGDISDPNANFGDYVLDGVAIYSNYKGITNRNEANRLLAEANDIMEDDAALGFDYNNPHAEHNNNNLIQTAGELYEKADEYSKRPDNLEPVRRFYDRHFAGASTQESPEVIPEYYDPNGGQNPA